MNFNHESTTSETYDPDSKVVRSTQTVEQNATDTNGSSTGAVSVSSSLPNAQQSGSGTDNTKSDSARTEETTNYEISKTVKTSTVDGGDVKRLSVAVVVDGETTTDAAGKDSYRARTPQEMAQIQSLVKSAMGFDSTRGDQLQVANMQFARIDGGSGTPAPAPFLGLDGAYWFKIIEAAILSITALLIGLFVARPLIQRMFAPLRLTTMVEGPMVAGALPAPDGSPVAAAIAGPAGAGGAATTLALQNKSATIDISGIDGQVRESAIRKVGEVVQAHPDEALALLRTWLHQPA
jgi:flagellar M-ring protein FliF